MRLKKAVPAALALFPMMHGCSDPTRLPEAERPPVSDSWQPEIVLRERVPRGIQGEVVLDDRDGLSPDEGAILAIDQNPRLRAIRADRGIGQAELIRAGVLPNPRIEGTFEAPTVGPEARVLGYGVALAWNVTPLLSRAARVRAATHSLASIDLEIGWQEWQVAQSARLHTTRCIYLERRAQVAHEVEETWARRAAALERARAAGAVTELEVVNAERSRVEANIIRLELEQRLVVERAELNRAIGIDPTLDIDLDSSFAPPLTVEVEGLLDELPRRRLDLIALQYAQRSQREDLRAAVIARFPAVDLSIQSRREVDKVGSAGITMSVALPFFDRNQAAIALAKARRIQVEEEYRARLLEARSNVLGTTRALSIVSDQLESARKSAEASEKLSSLAWTAAMNGALSPLIASNILEQSFSSRLRALEIEQTLVELQIALSMASGAAL